MKKKELSEIKKIDDRFYKLGEILEQYSRDKTYKLLLGPLGGFFSVELRYQQFLTMTPEIRENLVRLRKEKESIIITEQVPMILEKDVIKKRRMSLAEKRELEIVKYLTKEDNYGNELPVPYEDPISHSKRKIGELRSQSVNRLDTGHPKILGDTFVPVVRNSGHFRSITGHKKITLQIEHIEPISLPKLPSVSFPSYDEEDLKL